MKQKIILLIILILLLSIMPSIYFKPVIASGENWLTGFSWRKSHVINSASGADTKYQVKIVVMNGTTSDSGNTVYENNKALADWSDIRFTASDGSTLLDAWNETQTNGVSVTCWVEISDNLSAVSSTIYVYYGNTTSCSAYWNGEQTFLFFDHFDSPNNALNTTLWSKTASNVSVANGIVTVSTTNANTTWSGILGTTSLTYGRFRSLCQQISTTHYEVFGLSSETNIASTTVDMVYFYRNPSYYYAATHKHPNLDSSFTYSGAATMQTYEIDWCSVNATYYMGSTSLGNVSTNIPAVALNAVVTVASVATYGTVKVDWVFLAKYVFPEPSDGSWTNEEVFLAYTIMLYFTSGVSIMTVNGTIKTNGSILTYYSPNNTLVFQVVGLADYAFRNWTYDGSSNASNPFYLTYDINYTLWCYLDNNTFGGGGTFIYARFTMNDTAPYQNQDTVFFNASLSNCSSLPLSYYWEFGDSNISTGETTTYIYSTSGVFIVNLTVVNGAMSDSMFQNITVFATSINITFDWNDLLFGSGAWLPFIAIMIAMFIGVAINKWFIVAAFPIMALMSFLYFDHITTTPELVWEALIMICSAIVLLIYSASRK